MPKTKPPKKKGRLDMSYPRQERAAVALFRDGFALWEIAALMRWSEHSVHAVVRKNLR